MPEIDCSNDGAVSHRHAQLTLDHDRWYVEDLGSTNGTFVGTPGDPLPDDAARPQRTPRARRRRADLRRRVDPDHGPPGDRRREGRRTDLRSPSGRPTGGRSHRSRRLRNARTRSVLRHGRCGDGFARPDRDGARARRSRTRGTGRSAWSAARRDGGRHDLLGPGRGHDRRRRRSTASTRWSTSPGAGIGDRRWTDARKQLILESRTRGTRLLADTISRASSGSRRCSCPGRPSGTTATGATRSSPRSAFPATTSSRTSAPSGRRRPRWRPSPASASSTSGPGSCSPSTAAY